jgi:hypothetical protein
MLEGVVGSVGNVLSGIHQGAIQIKKDVLGLHAFDHKLI